VSLTEGGYLVNDDQTDIISTQYLFDRMAMCVITSAGDIILWNVTSNEVCLTVFIDCSFAYVCTLCPGKK